MSVAKSNDLYNYNFIFIDSLLRLLATDVTAPVLLF